VSESYRDPDSGWVFPSYDDYMRTRLGVDEFQPTDEDLCGQSGHAYAGDDGDAGRCHCGLQVYPKGGPEAANSHPQANT